MIEAVKVGMGIAALPSVLGDADPNLIRCSEVIAPASSSAWIVTRRDLKDTPRMRAFIDFIVPYMQQDARRREAQNRNRREAGAPG